MAALLLIAAPAGAQDAAATVSTNLTGEDLEPLLPTQGAGWTRTSARFHDERPVLEAHYEKEGLPYSVELFLGYDAEHRQSLRDLMEQSRETTLVQQDPRLTFLLQGDTKDDIGLVAFSGEMHSDENELAALFLVCGEVHECTVPDAEAARSELFALYNAFDMERLEALRTAAEEPPEPPPSPGDTLRTLLPETLDGLTRGAVQSHSRRPMVQARYEPSDGGSRLEVHLAHGTAFQQRMQNGVLENSDELETIARGGQTLYLREESSAVSVFAFPGQMTLMVGMDGPDGAAWDADATRERLLRIFDALAPERLAAFTMPERDATSNLNAPEGFTAYAADLDDAQVAFAHPEGWTVVNLHRQTGFLQGITAVRDAEAAEELFGDGLSLSSEDKSRLVTARNVIVTIAVMGEGLEAESFLGSMIRQATLHEPTVVQAPTETTVNGHAAFEATARGQDADGRPVVQRQLAFTVEGTLFSVSILQPAEVAENLQAAVQSLLGSLSVTTR